MTELNPAARAIAKAFDERYEQCGPFDDNWQELCLAAALQELADLVVPVLPVIVDGGRSYEEAWTATVHEDIRRKILSIANGLETS